ncbi:LLM class F420-dependent oxidoreductase [Actinokineospora enzanensis]|uniref:LLM class F420-dependent oxidoreductase n=1 Tax=Actinokineospora enzanensis TaxID=155975 RepID=UPI00037901BA|nr:LLM class F420-dependent oxidoreductase [Actinokineospora enzanensis]
MRTDPTPQLRIFTAPQQGATYDDLRAIAKHAEDTGYDGFFCSDHYRHIGDTDGLPGPTDAWTTLAGLARDTTRITLGTLMTAATFRHPGPLAITVAQVDRMSGGRVELGLGAGWYAEEHTAYGIPFPDLRERFDRFAEQLEVITGLWDAPGAFSFHGKHYTLTDAPALPKPTRRPPVIIGGGGAKRTPALAARFANEFNLPYLEQPAAIERLHRVDAACEAIGRDPAEITRSIALTTCVGRTEAELTRRADRIGRSLEDLRATGLAGTPAEVVDRLGTWQEVGITRVYLEILDLDDRDHLDLIADRVRP